MRAADRHWRRQDNSISDGGFSYDDYIRIGKTLCQNCRQNSYQSLDYNTVHRMLDLLYHRNYNWASVWSAAKHGGYRLISIVV